MDARLLLERVINEIGALEKALDQKRLFARMLESELNELPLSAVQSVQPARGIQIPPKIVRRHLPLTLADRVRRAVSALNEEFDVGKVGDMLRAQGVDDTDGDLNAKVSTVVRRLHLEGVIHRTQEGAGSAPHKYLSASSVPLDEQNKVRRVQLRESGDQDA